jgi:hypothetical protein
MKKGASFDKPQMGLVSTEYSMVKLARDSRERGLSSSRSPLFFSLIRCARSISPEPTKAVGTNPKGSEEKKERDERENVLYGRHERGIFLLQFDHSPIANSQNIFLFEIELLTMCVCVCVKREGKHSKSIQLNLLVWCETTALPEVSRRATGIVKSSFSLPSDPT